jgi:glutamate formiminotransferase
MSSQERFENKKNLFFFFGKNTPAQYSVVVVNSEVVGLAPGHSFESSIPAPFVRMQFFGSG